MKTQTDKIAKASPYYARLLNSARAGETRRKELAKLMQTRRTRLAFEDALRTVAAG